MNVCSEGEQVSLGAWECVLHGLQFLQGDS